MWENSAERGRPQITIWRMRISYWIPKATDTHSECAVLIIVPPPPRKQWLRERATILRLYVQ
jgi:hypothetical protein